MYSNYNHIDEEQNENFYKIKYFFEKVPLFSRFILASILSFYLFTWLNYYFADMLSGIPYFIIKDFEFYRIITSFFVHYSFLQLILTLYFVVPFLIDKEKKIGSLNFIFDFFFQNILIQFLFLSIMLAFGIFDPKYFLTQKSSGLMNYFLLSLMLKSLEQPEEITNFLCLPYKIKNLYYLIFLVILLNVFFYPQFDSFVSIILGISEFHCFNNVFRLSRDKILDLETNSYLSFLINFQNFISYLESQTNLHVIDLISLNPNLKNELFVQNYELTGATKIDLEIDLKERMENKENLLDERLNIENEKPNDSNKE